MAQKVFVEMVDDLDGSTAGQTVPFGLDGVQYEIDLSDSNAETLRDNLAAYVAAARRTGGRRPTPAPTAEDRERSRAVRSWAVDNGWAVSGRGRIPGEVVVAYEKAQQEQSRKPRRKRGPGKSAAKSRG
ncbi:MAG TPA: Lsr2 family protein [Amycolatopsis sp.]|jgi:hypothetical protein|nr:Lsr2 family protein [Amycolatopsis sp.]